MDFACGTGLVGEALSKIGITDIQGMDISDKMMEKAREKGVYSNLTKLDLGQKDFYGTFPPLMI